MKFVIFRDKKKPFLIIIFKHFSLYIGADTLNLYENSKK